MSAAKQTAAAEIFTPTLVMGIVNVTPDSFSDGGNFLHADRAVAHGLDLIAAGADILDVGGESTRPGATPLTAAAEQERILPVIQALAEAGQCVSVDTYHAATAAAAARAGAVIINDVSGGLGDPQMHATVADLGLDYVLQHWRGTPQTMNDLAVYRDCVGEVYDELAVQFEHAVAAGIAPERIIIDPGFGFAKNSPANWELIAEIERFKQLSPRVLVGASRKRFVADIVRETAGEQATTSMLARDQVSAMIALALAEAGVWAIRAHNALLTRQAVAVAQAIAQGAARANAEGAAQDGAEGAAQGKQDAAAERNHRD